MFARAITAHQQGRTTEAAWQYQLILDAAPTHFDALHNLAVVRWQQGRSDEAMKLVQRALNQNPRSPDANVTLGNILATSGKPAEARGCFERAAALNPNHVEAYRNLAAVAVSEGDLPSAMAHLERALTRRPGDIDVLMTMGIVLRIKGDDTAALARFEAALALAPDHPELLHNTSNLYIERGESQKAVSLLERALAWRPDFVEALNNLGFAKQQLGDWDGALRCYDKALALKPDFGDALINSGVLLQELGKLDEARARFERALAGSPDSLMALNNLAVLLRKQGKLDEAMRLLEHALALSPNAAQTRNNLGLALQDLNRPAEAAAQYRQAIAANPQLVEPHINLGNILMNEGRFEDASASFKEALRLRPEHPWVSDNLLFCLNYREAVGKGEVFAAHRDWGLRFAGTRRVGTAARVRNGSRLRVGYMSPDLREHSVAHFLSALLAAHDRKRIEAICYAQPARRDAMSARLQELSDGWVELGGGPAEPLAERIAADGVDILVDLAGHTAGARLDIFAHKPAPVQISWLGYPNTTGLPAIDYRITDAVADPPGEDEFYTERLLRLDRCFVCYWPHKNAPAVTAPPAAHTGRVTFGSFNTLAKLSPATIALWAEVLRGVPESSLYLKAGSLADAATCERVRAAFAAEGIAAGRLRLEKWTANAADHLSQYHDIDIALDPVSYNGTTTTCEALWMGVPVVSLRGERHASRVGASLLNAVRLDELIASDAVDYVSLAKSLAEDAARLSALREGMRERLRASALCDATGFARAVESAYETAWQQQHQK